MKCPGVLEIADFVSGGVEPKREEFIRRHIVECEECLALEEDFSSMSQRLAPDAGEFHDPNLSKDVMTLIRLGQARRGERVEITTGLRQWVAKVCNRLWWNTALTAAATAAVVALIWPTTMPRSQDADEFQARTGSLESQDRWVSLYVFRAAEQGYEPVRGTVHGDDALAFAYLNRPQSGYRFLSVFAVDGQARVFWYFPNPQGSPGSSVSVPIVQAHVPLELQEQVRHEIKAGPLRIFGVFSQKPLRADDIEAQVVKRVEQMKSVRELKRIDIPDVGQHSYLLVVQNPTRD